MAGNKKEIIRELKTRLEICTSKKELYKAALEPVRAMATKRGARMQIMWEFIQDSSYIFPEEFREWFDSDGVSK